MILCCILLMGEGLSKYILYTNSLNSYICWRNLVFEINKKLSVYENGCLRTMVGISYINHIKMVDMRSDLGMLNKITDIIKKKKLKWFGNGIHEDNVIFWTISTFSESGIYIPFFINKKKTFFEFLHACLFFLTNMH